VIVWLLTVAAGGANWGELRVADGFFLCFPRPLFLFSCCSRFCCSFFGL
jgi:hypothetical protein